MKMRTRSPFSFAAALLLAAPALAQVPAGPNIMLSEGVGSLRGTGPAAAARPAGDYVVVWNSRLQDGETVDDVFGRLFRSDGTPVGGEFRVNTYTTGLQGEVSARPAVDGRGAFVVVWESATPTGYHIFGQRFARDGTRRGVEFLADTLDLHGAGQARVSGAPDGRFLVAWSQVTGEPNGKGSGVFARRYDAAGNAAGAGFLVNTYTSSYQASPDVAMRRDGSFVVVWSSYLQDGDEGGIFLQRYDAAGVRLGAETRLNAFTTGDQAQPALAMARDGSFVVAWTSSDQDGDGYAVMARRFDAGGAPLGTELQVNTHTLGDAVLPSVSADERGDFVVVWQEPGTAPGSIRISGRRFAASGAARGAEFVAADNLLLASGMPNVASDRVGNFLVSYFFDFSTSADSPRAQRYQGIEPSLPLVDASGNGVLDPGEAAAFSPAWSNVNGVTQNVAGAAVAFTGPAGGTYTIVDGTATYPPLPSGTGGVGCSDCYQVAVSDPSVRPAAHWDTVLEERLTPDVQGQDKLWTLHVGRSFTDVPTTGPFYRFVEALLHYGVTAGCGNGLYCPAASTTREQMAVFVLVAGEGAGYAPPPCGMPRFDDVPADSPFCRWIEELARRGVAGGCGGQSYCPGGAVTREQMAVFVLRTLDPSLDPPACTEPTLYTDVPASSPFCRWIEELTRRGIVNGCGNGAFCPQQPVTREQMGVFLGLPFGLALYAPLPL